VTSSAHLDLGIFCGTQKNNILKNVGNQTTLESIDNCMDKKNPDISPNIILEFWNNMRVSK